MNKKFFLEFWDVGGSRKYQQTRQIFYSQINGIMLVFDLNNKKSYINLRKWIKEIVHVHKTKGIEEKYVYHDAAHGGSTSSSYDNHVSSSLGSLPVIVVGNKKDLQDKKNPRTYNTVKDLGFNCVYVSALDKFTTEGAHSLDEFFQRVIERRFYRAHTDKHSSKVLRRSAPATSDGDSSDALAHGSQCQSCINFPLITRVPLVHGHMRSCAAGYACTAAGLCNA
eukprot:CAMPEP_0170179522 /NCGR_PEP_ID=MMETSP0040_2-20121228/18168_1 /TAXON_ID=641309 /ORGANISM="Lotharella oceanica, Strain CCMP622" /LENGTH=223 /DNA_ID=CAMNT_0010423681 /DNA_START=150 /DNA_END=818 /DNA_ORIENTATION=+